MKQLFSIAILLTVSAAVAQEFGTVQEYRARVRGQNALVGPWPSYLPAVELGDFTDVKSFIERVKVARQRLVRELYINREQARRKAKALGVDLVNDRAVKKLQAKLNADEPADSDPRVRKAKAQVAVYSALASLNKQIENMNAPLNPYVLQPKPTKAILLHPDSFSLKVDQVLDKRNALVTLSPGKKEIWLTGVDTSTWTDDASPKLQGLLLYEGTKTYPTADGTTKTDPKMRWNDLKPFEEALTRREEVRTWSTKDGKKEGILWFFDDDKNTVSTVALDGSVNTFKFAQLSDEDKSYVRQNTTGESNPERVAAQRDNAATDYRQWTSADGKFSYKAKIVSYADGTVTLENPDGKTTNVPAEKLAEADQAFVKKWREEQ